jgi:hypothetical protein
MTKIALACAVMLASLFTVSAQADAAGFKPRYGVQHSHVHKFQKHKVYKANTRLRAMRRFHQRFTHKRHRKPNYFVRRFR